MTDQQQGAPLAEPVDQHAYLLGGIRVQMGQWLIQQPQRRVAQQQARQRQAALLPAGQAQPAFAQRGLQAQRQTPQQRGQTNLPQHAPQLPLRGPGRGQPQVVRHTGSQQLWLLGQITYPGLPGRTLQLGQLPTVDLQASLIGDKLSSSSSRVDLPLPLGPCISTRWPGARFRSRGARRSRPCPPAALTCCSSSAGAPSSSSGRLPVWCQTSHCNSGNSSFIAPWASDRAW